MSELDKAWARAARDVERRRAALADAGEHTGFATLFVARCITFLRYAFHKEA